MTETQATSGAAGTSTNPADTDKSDGNTAAGRAAVGRATVPATESSDGTGASPKYTRAPGMQPPPDAPPESSTDSEDKKPGMAPVSGGGAISSAAVAVPPMVTASATVPVVTAAPVSVGAPFGAAPTAAPAAPGRAGATRTGVTGRVAVGTSTIRPLPGLAGAVGAARVTDAVRTARTSGSAAAARGPRRARLNVKRVDPWSVMKFSFAVSLVLFIVVIVATSVLYLALDAMGVFDSVNATLLDMLTSSGETDAGGGFKITAKGVIGTAALLGAVNVVLFTALATLAAFVYNVCADLVGGIELTLSERD